MPAALARVATDRPVRYLAQLCRHVDKRRRHRPTVLPPRPHLAGAGGRPAHPAPEGDATARWSGTAGTIDFGWARCTLEADTAAGVLVLRAEAADAEGLRHLQSLLAFHLARFSRRHPLTVTWHPVPAAGSADG